MRLHSAAPRAHTAPPTARPAPRRRTWRRRLTDLLTLSLLGAPCLAGSAFADDAPAPAPAEATPAETTPVEAAEGVVTLTDARRINADADVRPAGLLDCCKDDPCAPVCDAPCPPLCPPACDDCTCEGTTCDGSCCPGGAGKCCLSDLFGGGRRRSCGPGYGGPGYGRTGCPHCPGGVCPPGVPCPFDAYPGGIPCPGACLLGGGVPLLGGGVCLPGLCPSGVPYWLGRCGGPEQCYLCSLLGVGANAANGRRGLAGCYEHVYAVNPGYTDRREGNVWASQQTGVPTAVPLAPQVRHTMEYGWGMPSSRLVPISRPAPPSFLYGPPAGVDVELPATRKLRAQNLPIIPDLGDGHLPRTGVAFPRTIDNAGNR